MTAHAHTWSRRGLSALMEAVVVTTCGTGTGVALGASVVDVVDVVGLVSSIRHAPEIAAGSKLSILPSSLVLR